MAFQPWIKCRATPQMQSGPLAVSVSAAVFDILSLFLLHDNYCTLIQSPHWSHVPELNSSSWDYFSVSF
jgi:hypothetical protein